jgi:hypothetical protein
VNENEVVAADCSNLRQGDIVQYLSLPSVDDDSTTNCVAVISQTCDVVQPSKVRCLIAPVIEANSDSLRDARKGRKPLHLFLESGRKSDLPPCVVDMERATSVLKTDLVGKPLLARYVPEASSIHAGNIAARVGRAYNRFPFPDEVYPFFNKLRSHVQGKSGTVSPFGQVIDLVCDLRVSANHWTDSGRRLTLYVVIEEERLIPREDFDLGWVWGDERVHKLKRSEELDSLKLNRVCELLLANDSGDPTTLAHLWIRFGDCMAAELLHPNLNDEVTECFVEVLSDTEMTYRQYQRTVSLDLEVLSDSAVS